MVLLRNRKPLKSKGDTDLISVPPFLRGYLILFGECKYSKSKKGLSVLSALKDKSKDVKWNKTDRNEHFVIYSKNGFSDELLEYAENSKNIYLRN